MKREAGPRSIGVAPSLRKGRLLETVHRFQATVGSVRAVPSYGYGVAAGKWGWFLVLYLVPDLLMVGYLANPRLGSFTYNSVHTYVTAAVLLGIGRVFHFPTALNAGLLLTAHIGMDRCLGFGLKYPTAFKDTHMQRV